MSDIPARIQLRRAKGWRKPDGAVLVARPSKWGNPFPLRGDWIMWTAVAIGYRGDAEGRRTAALTLYRSWLLGEPVALGPLAAPSGGELVFDNGETMAFSDHVRGFAAVAASISERPTLPDPPTDFAPLQGRDLACWCPLDEPCHADVLLELANVPAGVSRD